jgi:ABC-type glutathione transport system ATPase component
MEEIAQIARRVTVLAGGQVVLEGTPRQVFKQPETLASYGLDVPLVVQVMDGVAKLGFVVPKEVLTVEEVALL